ncbi:hypothetical protein [Nocardioides salsibiostraticola]
MPDSINAPSPWSDEERVDGPLAALGISTRTVPVGVTGQSQRSETFGVSAVDGHETWVELPGIDIENSGLIGQFALSPDGRWVGWSRHAEGRGSRGNTRFVGWAVMDTTSGEIRELADPDVPRVRDAMADLAFSGDSRYLLTSYETPSSPARRGHQFVAWDVQDGSSVVIEEPGKYWLPIVGSAPTGVVWARGRTVYRHEVATGRQSKLTLPHRVVAASWAPDDTAFAYVGAPNGTNKRWRLYAGSTVEQARDRTVALPRGVDPYEILGWVDDQRVVVAQSRNTVSIVDITTGAVDEQKMAGSGEQVSTPVLAADLWQNPLVAAVAPDEVSDPRQPWRWFTGALLAALAAALLWRRQGRRVLPRAVEPSPSMRPLTMAATGLLMVLVDLNIGSIDLVPDPVGWVLAAVALTSLHPVHRGFYVAGLAAWVAVVPSAVEWLGIGGGTVTVMTTVALFVVEVATCTALMAVRRDREWSASTIRWLTVVLGVALGLALIAASMEPNAGIVVFAVALADLLVTVWFVVLLYGAARGARASEGSTAGRSLRAG